MNTDGTSTRASRRRALKEEPPTSPDNNDDHTEWQSNAPPRRILTKQTSYLVATQTSYVPMLLSLSLYTYVGQFLRWYLALLFGLACHEDDPSVLGDWAPCTTAPGTTAATGGAFFVDIPANVIGCFIMGFLVSGDADMLPVDLPMAFLSRSNRFQQWKITHLGLRTGFCGALTTFASWNTQMVIMLCGGDGTELGASQWVSVLWGYLVGWMIAMESFRVGRDVAHAISRRNNPDLAKEADVIREKEDMGVYSYVNRTLPDFERRFLYDLMIEDENEEERNKTMIESPLDESIPMQDISTKSINPRKLLRRKSSLVDDYGSVSFSMGISGRNFSEHLARIRPSNKHINLRRYGSNTFRENYQQHIHYLDRWKESTERHRKPGSEYSDALHEVEHAILVANEEPGDDLLVIINGARWNYEALKSWKEAVGDEDVGTAVRHNVCMVELPLHASVFALCTALLIWGAIRVDNEDDPIHTTYRSQCLAALFAPAGTLLRWLLSKWNGAIPHKNWEWLPIGTLLANLMACVISVLMPALMLRTEPSPLVSAFMGAIKTGFAGSLSTVSTFAAETVGLYRALPQYFWGYYYGFGSIFLAAILGVIFYIWTAA